MRSAKTTKKEEGVLVRSEIEIEIDRYVKMYRGFHDSMKPYKHPSTKVIKQMCDDLEKALMVLHSVKHDLLRDCEKLPLPPGLLRQRGGKPFPNYWTHLKEHRDHPEDLMALISSASWQNEQALIEEHREWLLSVTFTIMKEAAEFLHTIRIEPHRPKDVMLGHVKQCAFALGNLFLARTKRHHWQKVGEALAKGFPEAVPGIGDPDSPTDLRLWAYKLARRHELDPVNSMSNIPAIWASIERQYNAAKAKKTHRR
jgi:hypothetical protein